MCVCALYGVKLQNWENTVGHLTETKEQPKSEVIFRLDSAIC